MPRGRIIPVESMCRRAYRRKLSVPRPKRAKNVLVLERVGFPTGAFMFALDFFRLFFLALETARNQPLNESAR